MDIKVLEDIQNQLSLEITNTEILAEGKNWVAKVEVEGIGHCVLKVFTPDEGLFNSSEKEAYSLLADFPHIKKVIASGSVNGIDFILTEFVENKENTVEIAKLSNDIASITDQLKAFKGDGFGPIKGQSFSDWACFLEQYFSELSARIVKLDAGVTQAYLSNQISTIKSLFAQRQRELKAVEPVMILVDMNQNNFIYDGDKLLIVDLESIVYGDVRLCYGEWINHSYGTEKFSPFFEAVEDITTNDIWWVRFYALIAAVDILTFIAEQNLDAALEATPWGAPYLFCDLIKWHRSYLFSDTLVVDPITSVKYEFVKTNTDGHKKPNQRSTRMRDSNESLAYLESIAPIVGITRTPDITGLDVTGINAYQCVRPDAEIDHETFTVFSGKGLTPEACKASAIAEAIERFCGESKQWPADKIIVGSYRQLTETRQLVFPPRWGFNKSVGFKEDEIHEWIETTNLLDGGTYLVPAESVFYPYSPKNGRAWFRYYTTGLAAGNSYLEALVHGLTEVIERDSAALNLISQQGTLIDNKTVDDAIARELITKLTDAGLEVYIRDITTDDIGIPCFSVICDDVQSEDNLFISGGYGCHPNKNVALVAALTESALTRASTISGAREDIFKFEYKREIDYQHFKEKNAYWFDRSELKSFGDVPTYANQNLLDDFALMLNRLVASGFQDIYIANLLQSKVGLPVVKVIVPGIERYSFRMECIGLRGRKAYVQSRRNEVA